MLYHLSLERVDHDERQTTPDGRKSWEKPMPSIAVRDNLSQCESPSALTAWSLREDGRTGPIPRDPGCGTTAAPDLCHR